MNPTVEVLHFDGTGLTEKPASNAIRIVGISDLVSKDPRWLVFDSWHALVFQIPFEVRCFRFIFLGSKYLRNPGVRKPRDIDSNEKNQG